MLSVFVFAAMVVGQVSGVQTFQLDGNQYVYRPDVNSYVGGLARFSFDGAAWTMVLNDGESQPFDSGAHGFPAGSGQWTDFSGHGLFGYTVPQAIPDVGVDIGAWSSALISALGEVVVIVVGGIVAFMLVRAGMRWSGLLGGGPEWWDNEVDEIVCPECGRDVRITQGDSKVGIKTCACGHDLMV